MVRFRSSERDAEYLQEESAMEARLGRWRPPPQDARGGVAEVSVLPPERCHAVGR